MGNDDLTPADLPAPTRCEVPTLERFPVAHVSLCLKKLSTGKATGPNEISDRALKE